MTSTQRQNPPAEQRRGRPRSEAAERSITEAVVQLLEEGASLADLSIERIARTAGVGKATIYRRWKGKEELFLDVLKDVEPTDPELPGTSVRDDLVAMLESLRQRGLAKRSSALLHNVFAQMQNYPKLWAAYHANVVEGRRRTGMAIVRRGIAEGLIRSDLDAELINDLFVGPVLLRAVLRPDGVLDGDLAEHVVDAVLTGLGPSRQPGPRG
ncbi:TetR/AcrR family transcriptional regulator [Streptomyces sp. NPDC051322]|uniref:TetR/AcrR family transcriptional regulator n=1 Tax=Streptomyces sp. NPDC051322 TaxID=3154645 RepID=UPI00344D19B3